MWCLGIDRGLHHMSGMFMLSEKEMKKAANHMNVMNT